MRFWLIIKHIRCTSDDLTARLARVCYGDVGLAVFCGGGSVTLRSIWRVCYGDVGLAGVCGGGSVTLRSIWRVCYGDVARRVFYGGGSVTLPAPAAQGEGTKERGAVD